MDIVQAIQEAGFESVGRCDASALRVLPDVREMCSSGSCRMYGTRWTCPPHCGSLEEFQTQFDERTVCFVFQTVVQLEDEFDGEGMMEAAELQAQRVDRLSELLDGNPRALIMGTGACMACDACTCPTEPCRHPERRHVSMEAAGLMVNDVCIAAGIPYNHGAGTIAYTGCVIA